jgi:hypothetical protein
MLDTPEEILAHLLTGVAQELDLPDALHEAIVREYGEVGKWLASRATGGTSDWDVYSQGSVRLGTVVLPTIHSGEYDIDLVCRRGLIKANVSQRELKDQVGDELEEFVINHRTRDGGPEGLKEGGRCWTLLYTSRRFHMDTLPAIPDPDGSHTAILITDRDFIRWQHSDPIGYSVWFRKQMEQQFIREREVLAKAARASVEEIPEWRVKTTMQRMVQVLKRHRDVHFADDLTLRPPSILVTTGAALTYQGDQNLFSAVLRAGSEMLNHFENRDGVIWLPNPINAEENFADSWHNHPERYQRFVSWLAELRRDLEEAAGTKGLPKIAERLHKGFGVEPVVKAAERLGREFRELRETGRLTATAAGTLGTKGITKVRDHTFYGETHR